MGELHLWESRRRGGRQPPGRPGVRRTTGSRHTMNAVLADIIQRFRAAQDRGVATLTQQLGVPLPTSNRQWITVCGDHGLDRLRSSNGTGVYAHGYGIE